MLRSLLKNRFLKASSIVFIGSIVANIINYLFNLLMGRFLSPAVYGELVALFTLLLIVGVPSATVTMILAQYSANHYVKNEFNSIRALFRRARTPVLWLGFGTFLLFIIFSSPISHYFHVPLISVLIFSLLMPITFFSAANSGFLQGMQYFGSLAFTNILMAGLKFGLSIFFVMLGFSLNGVLGGLILATLAAYFFSSWYLLSHLKKVSEIPHDESTLEYSTSSIRHIGFVFLVTLVTAIFVNVDLLLAKHYLVPELAGIYAALSVLGKIITYGTAAVLTVLFPLTSASFAAKDGKTTKLLFISLILVGVAAIFLTSFFALYPGLVVGLLFGASYVQSAYFLVYFAGAMGFSSIASVFVQYFLATKRRAFIYPLFALMLAEIVGIVLYHKSIEDIVLVSLVTSVTLCISLFITFLATKPEMYE